jgi:hypothetical protein
MIDPHEGAKTKHMASAYNIGVEQNNKNINSHSSGPYCPPYNNQTDLHRAASAFTQVPSSQNQSLERLTRYHHPDIIQKKLKGAYEPSYRPRTDDDREQF